MEATAKRRTRRRSPYVGSPCRACGHDSLVMPCTRPGCDRWLSVCGGCLDEIDRFVETDGRCPYCRVQ
jgi:DNA-directed RNA polymerase subunit RPC12/RpoP